MSRLEWVLGIALVVLLGIVIVLSLLFWFQPEAPSVSLSPNSATIIAAGADDIAPTSTFTGQTARVAFASAQTIATAWRDDAALLSATATWPQGRQTQELLGGETTWGFTFYSPGAGALALISVIEGQATLISETASKAPSRPLDVAGWQLDSPDAVKQFLEEQGESFMASAGVTTLTMMLSTDNQNDRIEWLVSLYATQTGGSLTMRIDATSGEILEIVQV
jgi:hypothetical protein